MGEGICHRCSTRNKRECSWEDHIICHEYYVEEEVTQELRLDSVKAQYRHDMMNSDALMILLIDELDETLDVIKQYALRIKDHNDWLGTNTKRQRDYLVVDYLSERLNEILDAEGNEWWIQAQQIDIIIRRID